MVNGNLVGLVIGLIVFLFGLSLKLFQSFWRGFGVGVGEVSAYTNNMKLKVAGLDKKFEFTGVDPKHSPSKNGLSIVGIIFMIFGVLIVLLIYM